MKDTSPVLSITMPVYNVEKYLRKGIESVLKQTFNDFELIIIDDGSTDTSGYICDRYMEKDSRIRVVHQVNQGLVSAREKAVDLARGRYIAFVDPDDWIEKDFFEKILNNMLKVDADIGIGGYVLDYGEAGVKKKFYDTDVQYFSREDGLYNLFSFKKYQWELWDKIYKSDILKGITVDYKITCGEDLCRTYQAFSRASKICLVPLYGYHYVQRKGSMTKKKSMQYVNTLYYAMTTLDFGVKKESKDIQDIYQKRKFRFLLLNIFDSYMMDNILLTKTLEKELSKNYTKVILCDYPKRFKIFYMFLKMPSFFKSMFFCIIRKVKNID